jgi:uroporphyrinogen III methyltransferase/synthase
VTVHLVGAGPGDPGLLTVRAVEVLQRADAVVHDRLVDTRVLALAPATAPRYNVGKHPGGAVTQEEINELLVKLAAEHDTVVRLKGGDPYVFGRGGEEALVLEAAGIDVDVVPGVSSVNGVLSAAGIPLTHRGLSAGFTVVSGHGAADGGLAAEGGLVADREMAAEQPAIDWGALALVGGTIVVLMGIGRRAEIAERLIAGGRSPSTPVAVIEHGTSSRQRTLRATLAGLGDLEPSTPAVIVIGEVAGLGLPTIEDKPLFGWRVLVTRSREQSSVLSELLARAGAEPIEVPTIAVEPPSDGAVALEAALARLAEFDWIVFSSANAVREVFSRLRDARSLAGLRVAAIGRATAGVLARHGVIADLVPEVAVAEQLAAAFGQAPPDRRAVLIPQAAAARPALRDELAALGYEVTVVEAYRTVHPPLSAATRASIQQADAVTFTSSSTVAGLLGVIEPGEVPPVVISIGPITSATARAHGLTVHGEAGTASMASLVETLASYAARHGRPAGVSTLSK